MRAAIPLALELDVLGVGHQMPAAPLTRLRALPWLLHEVVFLPGKILFGLEIEGVAASVHSLGSFAKSSLATASPRAAFWRC